jgi:hypothetical protein
VSETPYLDELRAAIENGMNSKRAKELAELTASIEKAVDFRIVHLKEVHAKDIAALEEKHAAEIAELQTQRNYEWDRRHKAEDELQTARKEIATLRATMAGMVCGACKGDGYDPATGWDWVNNQYITLTPCMVCQPKKGTE